MVKISDIAAELGVSRSLVSKVLSGHMGRSSVRPALAEKIRKRAAELGYVPNVAARVLFSGRQNTVGVFIARYGQPGSGLVENFLDGVSSVLHRIGQRMLLQFFRTEEDFRACMDTAHPSVMDGVIVAGMQGFDLAPGVRELLARNLPVATCFSEPLLEGVPNAGIDQREVGRTETLHVLSRGASAPGGGSGRHTLYRPPARNGGLPSGQLAKDSSVYELAVKREGDITAYELRIPWSETGGLTPAVGTRAGLSLQLFDADNNGLAPSVMTWGGGLLPEWAPSAFGLLTLID